MRLIPTVILVSLAAGAPLATGCSSAPEDRVAPTPNLASHPDYLRPPPPALQVCPMPQLKSGTCTGNVQGYILPNPSGAPCPDIWLPDVGENGAYWTPDSAPMFYWATPAWPGDSPSCAYSFDGIRSADTSAPIEVWEPASALCSQFRWDTSGSYILPSDMNQGPSPCKGGWGYTTGGVSCWNNQTWKESCDPEINGGCESCLQ